MAGPDSPLSTPSTVIADPITKTLLIDVGTSMVWAIEDARWLAELILERLREIESE